MKTTFKIIKQVRHDRYVFIHYNDGKEICGLNFHQGAGDDYIAGYFESDPEIMKEYKLVCDDLKRTETTETYRINTTLERYWKMKRLEEDGPQIKADVHNLINKFYNDQCAKYCADTYLNNEGHAELRRIKDLLITFLIQKVL